MFRVSGIATQLFLVLLEKAPLHACGTKSGLPIRRALHSIPGHATQAILRTDMETILIVNLVVTLIVLLVL